MEKEGTGTTYKIQAGDAYVFDNHESHYIRGGPDGAKIICIFTPACTGKEVSISTSFQKSYEKLLSYFKSILFSSLSDLKKITNCVCSG